MNYFNSFYWYGLLCFCLVLNFLSVGCISGDRAVKRADKRAYRAIDEKWEDSFGSRPDLDVELDSEDRERTRALIEQVERTNVLTMEQAVKLAVLNSHEYRLEIEKLYLAGLNQSDAEKIYNPLFSAGADAFYRAADEESAVEYRGRAGASQLLAFGTTIMADMTIGYVDVLTGDIRGGSSSIFQAAVVQPLLRGAKRTAVMETLTQAQRDTMYAVRDFNRFRKVFYVSIATDYYRLKELARRLELARKNVDSLADIVARMEDLVSIGRLSQSQLAEARQELLQARKDLLSVENEYFERLDLFKVRLNIPPVLVFEPSKHDWLALPDFLDESREWDEDYAVEVALRQRLDLANIFDRVEDARRQIGIAKNDLGMDLDLIGVAAPGFGSSESRYEAGIEADLPLNRISEVNSYRRATIALQDSERFYTKQRYRTVSEVRKAWRDMAEARNRYNLQRDARELARQRLDSTTALLEYRRADSEDILNAQEDLYTAENGFITALADFTVAQLELLRDTETLQLSPQGLFEPRVARE